VGIHGRTHANVLERDDNLVGRDSAFPVPGLELVSRRQERRWRNHWPLRVFELFTQQLKLVARLVARLVGGSSRGQHKPDRRSDEGKRNASKPERGSRRQVARWRRQETQCHRHSPR
jgi:hypothetical protein